MNLVDQKVMGFQEYGLLEVELQQMNHLEIYVT